MKFDMVTGASALLWLIAGVEASGHARLHQSRHQHGGIHSVAEVGAPLEKRGGKCEFPTDAGLVAVTPNMKNAGWAMSPDQPCEPGHYCPYACPPGQVSMQWDPKATSYSYPKSMNGGLYCDDDGKIQKPFPNKPYCQDGTGSVGARNKCGKQVAFCQTVLPGNEAMLIPTLVEELATLAVPDLSYWCETAAHFYINPPGYDTETACVWGTSDKPIGNWSPYVAGTNTDGNGNTFLKIGWNPIYLEPATPFRNEIPEFGVEIECEGGGCNGLPCKIDPAVNGVNEMVGSSSVGAGGATFCVVTVPKGEKANVVVFNKSGGGGGGGGGGSSSTKKPEPTTKSDPTTKLDPTTKPSESSTKTAAPSSTDSPSTSTDAPSSTSDEPSSTYSSASSTTITTTTPSVTSGPSQKAKGSKSEWPSGSASSESASSDLPYTYEPQMFVKQSVSVGPLPAMTTGSAQASPTPVPEKENGSAANAAVSVLTLGMGAVAAIMVNL
ncbi:SUN domain-containing protein [Aspergillus clavatus NRRL 1]|uniref:SUN domain protein (Adg3), putative n=1 Tax=Aspergillus clavatus (strain ATCC 1007 / CBS 513.65 / DSM 816 / NCTC 3887 / NRRL 1 / QM 1276 / 107) TaxID=344612 RepID=A1CP67_ASPCL|nr:SUN domain protein (Adg3), putative [Aspergillus clavatus NRRL 1]EAW07438.1 SUN domain protein (Adg3), putative [Aspergillus clavatus NRRL 1]